MGTATLVGVVAVSIVLIIVSFIVGRYTVKRQEQLNNDEVLRQRALIQKDVQALDREYQEKKKLIDDAQNAAKQAYDEKLRALDIEYQHRDKDLNAQYQNKTKTLEEQYILYANSIQQEKELVQSELDSLKNTKAAAIEAARKEREVQEQPDKYCIQMSDDEIHDIEYLNGIMPKLKFPEVLGKCIWSVFFQKKTKAFFANILGSEEVCGIYKITDQLTGESYIGQSVKIKTRWVEHIKCGIGAMPASNANQLYAAMRRDGIWNFSFELLTECSKEELDTQERRFIDLYASDAIGLNSKRGNQSNTLKE